MPTAASAEAPVEADVRLQETGEQRAEEARRG